MTGAYALMGRDDPLRAALALARGFHEVRPLEGDEIDVLFPCMAVRLATSVILSAMQRRREPDNEYLLVSEKPAWVLIERFCGMDFESAAATLRRELGVDAPARRDRPNRSVEEILHIRSRHLGPSLSVSYDRPLKSCGAP